MHINERGNFYEDFFQGNGSLRRSFYGADRLCCPAGGAQLVWRFDRRNQVYLDARYVVTPLRFVQSSVSERIGKVGLATLLVGYSHTFSKVSFR